MRRSNSTQSRRWLSIAIWVVVLVLMLASATHLLRTALRAGETRAILIAAALFSICILFRVGHIDTRSAPHLRRYIPWSAIPILGLAIWAANMRLFGAFDVSAVLFHLKHSLAYEGVGDDIIEFGGFILFAVILIACLSFLARRDRRLKHLERLAALALLLINPVTGYAYDRLLNPDRGGINLREAYVPTALAPAPETPKNLIIIYLESMEATYAQPAFGSIFEDLNRISEQGLRINGVAQIQDTGWTMAALVASQCGVPLLSYGLVMKNRMKNIKSFLPSADCLATQLSERGYGTRYIGGAPLNFAGKGTFLKTHGYQRAIGLEDIPDDKRGEVGEWGIYDDRLFELALEELDSLASADAPYLLSILTLGAHFPAGYPAPSCYETIANAAQMDSSLLSVACTARLTRDFLREAEARGYLADTVVVLMSDHLSQKNTQTAQLNRYTRENFLLLLGPDNAPDIAPDVITKRAAMIDVYPTLLDSLGLLPATDKAALGTSLLGAEPTLLEAHGEDALNLAIRADRDLREQLWNLAPPEK